MLIISWILLIIFIGLAFYSPWWFIGVALVFLWKVGMWFFLKGRPWRRIHYPMMRAYASAAGLETGQAEKEGREYNIRHALANLLSSVKPEWNDIDIASFIDREFQRCDRFEDESLIKKHIERKNPKIDDAKLNELMQNISTMFNNSDKGLMVRMIIAGIIEQQYGHEQRGEYLYEVVIGRAK